MFKQFSSLPDAAERLEIFNLLKFNLALGRRLAEGLTIAVLAAGMGGFFSRLSEPTALWPAAALTIGLLLLSVTLPRWLFLALESALLADFGLDTRTASRRLAERAALETRRLPAAWVLSTLLFWGLTVLELWLWTLAALALGAALLLVDSLYPRLLTPQRLRPLRDGELPAAILSRFGHWCRRAGLKTPALRVATGFQPELRPPYLTGFGPTLTLIIPEKALANFRPREIVFVTVAAMVEFLVKAPPKFLFLRGCALAASGALAALALSSLGASLWLYPLTFQPALVTLIWLAAWLGLALADFSARITRRDMETQLAAAAAAILKDEKALTDALTTLAAKNLEESAPPAWREIFRRRFSRAAFWKRYQFHRQRAAFSATAQTGPSA